MLPIVLALKRRFDPWYYDRSAILRMLGYADSYITEAEVDEAWRR
jgi:hypothetical protein